MGFTAGRRGRAFGAWLLLPVCPLYALAPAASIANHELSVEVEINRVRNTLVRCFDPLGFGCSRPDYFAVITINSPTTQQVTQCNTRFQRVDDRDTVDVYWPCSGLVEEPGASVSIDIIDFDGGLAGFFDGNDAADVAPGPGGTLLLTPASGVTPFDRTGADTQVLGKITANRKRTNFVSFTLRPSVFDPRLGEIVLGEGALDHTGASLLASVVNPAGVHWVLPVSVEGASFSLSWDGRLGGTPAPPGVYTVELIVPSPADVPYSVATAVVELVERPPSSLALVGVDPRGEWNPGIGSLIAMVSTGSGANVRTQVREGTCAAPGTVRRTLPERALPGGVSQIGWDGRDDFGAPVPPGSYVLEISGSTASGAPTSPASLCVYVAVVAAPPMVAAVEHEPVAPVVGEPLVLDATVLDVSHRPRTTARVELWLADPGQVATGTEPAAPAGRCERVYRCRVSLPTATTIEGRIAYRAVARDLDGSTAASPWRMLDVTSAGAVPPLAMAGVAAEVLGVVRQDRALDLVFMPGSNFDVSSPTGRAEFQRDVAAHIKQLWGVAPVMAGGFSVRPSSPLLANQQHNSFWISFTPVRINSDPTKPFLDNLCEFSAPNPPFADVSAVIHRMNCRDNAPGATYSAKSPLISWHEVHHAAFGLADEYCCDGGYFENNPHANLYFWPGDCSADPNVTSAGCAPIRPGGGIYPGDWTRWWRLDPEADDVMVNNTFERIADRRRASWYFDHCAQGSC